MITKIHLTIEIELPVACDEDSAWQIVRKILLEARDEGARGLPKFSAQPHTVWFDSDQAK